jgi:hypothetical protein
MNNLKGCWKIIIILCVFSLVASGCVTQPLPRNATSILSNIFSAPTGGFVHPEKYVIQDTNTSFESDYVFYSRDWSGEVHYSVFGKYKGQILNDSSTLYVEPSTFTAEPNHVYTSKVYFNTSTLPKNFFINTGSLFTGCILYFNVSLDGTDSLFCNDNIDLQSYYDKPHPPYANFIDVENEFVSLKKGETKNFTIIYQPDWYTSPEEISYSFSKTPLNVTITPSRFIARHDLKYPVVVYITADPGLDSGQYPVNFVFHGVNEVSIGCDNCRKNQPEKTFGVNVAVE